MIIFLSLALVGLFFLLVSAMFGDHTDTHAEVDAGHFGFLSVRLLAVFLLAFGSVGAIAHWYGMSTLMSSVWGMVAAIPLSAVYALAMNALKSQQASSLVEDCDLVGRVGRVTVTIAPGAIGEVSCTVKAQTARRLARSLGAEPIAEGAIVRVVEVQGDVVVVEAMR
jgi:membrane protein implicated in regulation of membrane protease activity